MTTPFRIVRRAWRPAVSSIYPYLAAAAVAGCLASFAAPSAAQQPGEGGAGVHSSSDDQAVDAPQVGVPEIGVPGANAEEEEAGARRRTNVDLKVKMDQKGTIAMREASLSDWLFAISREWEVNLVFSSEELKRQMVDGDFTDITLRDLLDVLLLTRRHGYQRVGNSLMILPDGELGTYKPQFKDMMIRLQYNNPQDVVASVNVLTSPGGEARAIESAKSIFVADLPERLERISQHIASLENHAREIHQEELRRQEVAEARLREQTDEGRDGTESESSVEIDEEVVSVYRLRFVDASSIFETLQSILGPETRVTSLEDENKLVVMAPASTIRGIDEIIRRLDVARPQVRITALLYDVNVEEMEKLGFNWSNAGRGRFSATGDPRSLFEFNSTNFDEVVAATDTTDAGATDPAAAATSVVTAPIGGLLRLRHLSRHFDLNTVFQALSQLDGARLLARPNVIAYDGVSAEFRSVSEIPVQQLTQTSEGGSIGTTEFREAGITLRVTPRINDDGSLRLEIEPEFSVLSGFQAGQPIIDRRLARTTVHLIDGQTIVIGGLLRRNELETQLGVPGLKNLKHFGRLFRNHDTSVSESELLVFVRAEIIGPRPEMAPREHIAASVLDETVERIPVATPHPVIPHCGDPYCPYHCPAPKWIDGMVYEGGPGIYEAGPHGAAEGLPSPNAAPGPGASHGTSSESWSRPAPRQPTGSPHNTTRPLPATNGVELPHHVEPPPVRVDDAARMQRRPRRQYAIRRLPHISHEAETNQLAPAGAPYIPAQSKQRPLLRPLPSSDTGLRAAPRTSLRMPELERRAHRLPVERPARRQSPQAQARQAQARPAEVQVQRHTRDAQKPLPAQGSWLKEFIR